MTKRATFTQAEIARHLAVADKCGKVLAVTPSLILFLKPSQIVQTPDLSGDSDIDTCAGKFGRRP